MSETTKNFGIRHQGDSVELDVVVEGVQDGDRIITLDDLIKHFGIDLDKFDVKSFKPNSWETHFKLGDNRIYRAVNYQAKVLLERNKDVRTLESIIQMFHDAVHKHSPTYRPIRRKIHKDEEGVTAIMDLFDLHIGMLAWGEETHGEDWDSNIGVRMAMEAIEDLIDRLQGMNITNIIVPMGNDLLHTDTTIAGKGGTTTGGTPQDVDTRYLKMYRAAFNLMVAIIDRLRQIAPVEVVVVPGNHDRERSAYLGETIFAWYRNDSEVVVNNTANLRKYIQVGTTLLGFTHGDQEKPEALPLLMASEEPRLWADCEFKVFHTGHFHRKRKMVSVTTDTYNGVEVLTLPSLVPADAWHAMKGYVGGGRAAEAHLIGEISGPCGYIRHNVYSNHGS